MNWLDKFISFLSPKRGVEREAHRQQLEAMQKSYDAGENLRNRDWRLRNISAEETDSPHREIIRARARDLERNSDIMNSLVSAFMRNVIGKGMTLQAKIYEADNKPNKELEGAIESEWIEWCKKENCDVTGSQSFKALIKMCLIRKKVDGGIILLKCFTKGKRIPFQLQAIEVDELDDGRLTPNTQGNTVKGGIEYDSAKKAVGYWIKQYSIDGITEADSKFFPASRVIFYWTKRRPSQIREMSDMTPSMTRIRDTNEFMNAVQIGKRVEAAFGVFISRQNPTSTGGVGRAPSSGGSERKTYEDKHLTPGLILEGNVGDQASVIDPRGRGADAGAFSKLLLQLIASGQGLSYEAVSRDMSQSNYSSARQGIIEDEMTFSDDIDELKAIMSEIYETFVISAVLANAVLISDFWDNKRKYLKHEWIKSPKPWIDPSKEATANKTAIDSGQKSLIDISAENGQDWQDKIDDMIAVQEYLTEKGYTMEGGALKKLVNKLVNDGGGNEE